MKRKTKMEKKVKQRSAAFYYSKINMEILLEEFIEISDK
jgi:hypothetical protein